MSRIGASAAVLGVFLTGAARAQQSSLDGASVPPPPLSAKVTDEAADVGYRPGFHLGSIFTFTPTLHGGLLAPYGTLPTPYSVLRTSPYGVVGLNAKVTGVVESLVIGTLAYTDLRSSKGIADPGGTAASPASSLPAQTDFSQPSRVASAYGDLGKVLTLSPSVKMAFFAAADAFEMNSMRSAPGSYGSTGLTEGNTGVLMMYKKGPNEVSAFTDFRLESAGSNMFRNGEYSAVPAGTFGAEYARDLAGGPRVAAGVEATTQRADLGLRPYAQWSHENVSTIVSGNFRRSKNDFYPDVVGGAAEVRVGVGHGWQVGVLGNYEREKYALAPGPVENRDLLLTATFDFDHLLHAEASKRATRRREGRDYRPQDSADLNNRAPASDYSGAFKSALAQSETLPDFIKSVHATSVDQILSAASAFTSSFNNNNYNTNEGPVPNANNIEDIYKRGRASYLSGTADPMLVCIGSSQFAAVLAEAMGKQAGIPIEAMASHVEVPDANGQQAGHAVAAVKTQPYGIVFVDWGKLTPTYTWDTKQAFRVYDALQGIPSVFHTVTAGDDGHHVGYLFTDEGKAIVNNLTFHDEVAKPPLGRLFNDDPRGAPITVERFKELTRGKF